MSKIKYNNLLKLAKYLENNVKDSQFDLSYYRYNPKGQPTDFVSKHDCGTVKRIRDFVKERK